MSKKRTKQEEANYLHRLLVRHPTIELEWEFVSANLDGWVTFKQGDRSFRAHTSRDEKSCWCVDAEIDDAYLRFYHIEDLVHELLGLYSYVRVEHHE